MRRRDRRRFASVRLSDFKVPRKILLLKDVSVRTESGTAAGAQPCTGRSVTCDTEMTTSRRDSLCNAYRFAQNVERTLAIPETPV